MSAESTSSLDRACADMLVCPGCGHGLEIGDAAEIACSSCDRRFPNEQGIPNLFVPHGATDAKDVTETVKAFYEETPFPNYDDLDSAEGLREKARKGVLARLLDEQPSDSKSWFMLGAVHRRQGRWDEAVTEF